MNRALNTRSINARCSSFMTCCSLHSMETGEKGIESKNEWWGTRTRAWWFRIVACRLQACAECSWNLQERRTARKKPVVVEPKKLRAWTVDRDVQVNASHAVCVSSFSWCIKFLASPAPRFASFLPKSKLSCNPNMKLCQGASQANLGRRAVLGAEGTYSSLNFQNVCQ